MRDLGRWMSAGVILVVAGCSSHNASTPSASALASGEAAPASSGHREKGHGEKGEKDKDKGDKDKDDKDKEDKEHPNKGGYETVFYKSGTLKIEAYIFRPEGKGPFPAIVYNHGARKKEEKEAPFAYVGKMLASHGYYVLVSERRGYGHSEGDEPSEAKQEGELLAPRMDDETSDVVAAGDYLKTVADVDSKRMGIVGWSLGGIVTVLALSKTHDFKAGVDQATAAHSWGKSQPIHKALTDAAGKIDVPLLSMDAENDVTNEPVKEIDAAMEAHHGTHKLIIYPKYVAPGAKDERGAGHVIFDADGMKIWENDVITWLDQYVKNAK